MATQENLEYSLASPYWRGRGNRLWTEESEENKAEFIAEICETSVGEKFCAMFDAESINPAWDKVIAIHESRSSIYGDEITQLSFIRCLTDAINSGAVQTPPPTQPKPRELSSSQKAWQEYRIFSEQHTSVECKARARVDAGYASFMRTNYEREASETPRLELTPLGQKAPTVKKVPADVQAYAVRYRTTAAAALRQELSPGMNPQGPAAAAEANRLFEAAIAAGLI